MDVRLPWWWDYATECENGHPWGPGRVIVSWMPCHCDPARAAQPRGSGHRVIACRTPGCSSAFYEPRHDPGSVHLLPAPLVPDWRRDFLRSQFHNR
jgi:hypothetical protein